MQPDPSQPSLLSSGSEIPLSGSSLCAKLARFFMAREGQWIDGDALRAVGGRYAYRTRVSELRRDPWAMDIRNRQRKVDGYTISEYRFVREDA